MSDRRTLEEAQFVFPCCSHHDRISADQRLKHVLDGRSYTRLPSPAVPVDPLKFRDGRRYTDRLKDSKAATGLDDAVLLAEGRLGGQPVVVAAQDFRFMGGSLGMAAGEAIITGMLHAVAKGQPFILFAASGGARMQEGILSLMQMPRTTIAVQKLREARLPYIVVLTDPTTGGVTASYAMIGDVHIAEPGALIGFAGPRVIQQTIREQLPEGFQRAEYLLEHGMIDMVVHRHKLTETLTRIVGILMAGRANFAATARSSDPLRHVNGHANGSPVDAMLLATRARDAETVDAEPVPDEDRFVTQSKKGPIRGSEAAAKPPAKGAPNTP
jgi:acetyl-CoA carboxylase carboxyl transferase subunit beta